MDIFLKRDYFKNYIKITSEQYKPSEYISISRLLTSLHHGYRYSHLNSSWYALKVLFWFLQHSWHLGDPACWQIPAQLHPLSPLHPSAWQRRKRNYKECFVSKKLSFKHSLRSNQSKLYSNNALKTAKFIHIHPDKKSTEWSKFDWSFHVCVSK